MSNDESISRRIKVYNLAHKVVSLGLIATTVTLSVLIGYRVYSGMKQFERD